MIVDDFEEAQPRPDMLINNVGVLGSPEAGSQREQIEMAVRPALERGLTTRRRLREAGSGRSARVRKFVERALAGAAAFRPALERGG